MAVARHVLDGRGDQFEPYDALTRGELARSLALTAELPQRIPAQSSFPDTASSDPAFPFVESVAGTKAKKLLMEASSGPAFKAWDDVRRLDFAVAMVRAAGLESAAAELAGASLPVVDEAEVPAELRGYALLALQKSFIVPIPGPAGPLFAPDGVVLRIDAAKFLLNLLDFRNGSAVPSLANSPNLRTEGAKALPRPGEALPGGSTRQR
jgi:hypothetical protein